mmetsp:Transcript_27864/g.63230  ORF Transcript_27864/g.63230 Transcript_27864/m.63230 type:complete len:142 (-) Transcript_27864:1269-1694(-)
MKEHQDGLSKAGRPGCRHAASRTASTMCCKLSWNDWVCGPVREATQYQECQPADRHRCNMRLRLPMCSVQRLRPNAPPLLSPPLMSPWSGFDQARTWLTILRQVTSGETHGCCRPKTNKCGKHVVASGGDSHVCESSLNVI